MFNPYSMPQSVMAIAVVNGLTTSKLLPPSLITVAIAFKQLRFLIWQVSGFGKDCQCKSMK